MVAEQFDEESSRSTTCQDSASLDPVHVVAHDFRNLMQCALSTVRVTQSRLLEDRQNKFAEMLSGALGALDRAASIGVQLLRAPRVGAPANQLVDVQALICSTANLLRRSMGDFIRIETRPSCETPPVRCEPHRLENALINLAMNARDAMPTGGLLVIESRARLCEGPAGAGRSVQVSISVADTGHGMTEDVASRAFRPFFTTKAETGGTGIGLVSVQSFVAEAGGSVELDTLPNQGTCVRLILPAAAAE
jgi:signal transduction histidine kinase